MKKGDKLVCKKDFYISVFKKGKSYTITKILYKYNDLYTWYHMDNGYYFPEVDFKGSPSIHTHFLTIKDQRKEKLEKLKKIYEKNENL